MVLNMLNKIISIALILCTSAYADDTPQYTHLEIGDEAPFAGTLFNPSATATLIAESQFNMSDCDLRVEYEVERTSARYQLQLDLLQASYDSLDERHNLLMDIKDEEIDTYRTLSLDRPNKNNHWWLAGGIVAGVSLTLGVLFATQEIQQ